MRKVLSEELRSDVVKFRWYADLKEEERRLRTQETEFKMKLEQLSSCLSFLESR